MGSTATALAQEKKSCSFDIVGTWKAQVSPNEAVLYRFDSNDGVTVLSDLGTGEPRQIATAKYEVINELGKPESVSFTASGKDRIFGAVRKTMKLVSYDDTSITCAIPGIGTFGGPGSIPTGISLCSRHARESSTITVARRFPWLSNWLEEFPQSTPSASI